MAFVREHSFGEVQSAYENGLVSGRDYPPLWCFSRTLIESWQRGHDKARSYHQPKVPNGQSNR